MCIGVFVCVYLMYVGNRKCWKIVYRDPAAGITCGCEQPNVDTGCLSQVLRKSSECS